MLLTYNECVDKFGSKYNIRKLVANGVLFQLEKGLYSEKRYIPEYQVISKKYPKAIFTLNSAYYYHQLTDIIPDKYYLATGRAGSKIADARVVQIFENSEYLDFGAEMIKYGNTEIYMYNKERLLVELLRNKNKLPFDYYKEILVNYRKIIDGLDIQMIQDMAMVLPKSRMIMEALQMEVL
ncbi:MAG: hypothetical protein MJ166_11130 [Clostridia bacterium]|nr:hypothetical protein [Clostridia bacterium]